MLKGLLIFGAGIYTGMYLTQNYKMPQVDKPEQLLARLKEKIDDLNSQYRKGRDD